MAPLPNSGTGQRLAIHSLASGIGAGLGGAGGTVFGPAGIIGGSAGGAIAGAATPAILGRLLMSAPAQAYLGNALPGQAAAATRQSGALARALLRSIPATQRATISAVFGVPR